MKKRILSILLCICMALSLLPMTVLAAGLTVSIGTTNLMDGKYYTVKTGADLSYVLVEEAAGQPTEGPYLYFSDGILTISGNVSITSGGPSPLTISGDKLTIGGSGSLSLNSSVSPAISISDGSLSLSGSVNFSAEQTGGAVPAIAGGSMETEDGYSGDITVSSNGSSAFGSMNAVDLQTTGNISISGGGSAPVISSSGAVTLKGSTVSLTNSNTSGGQLIIAEGGTISATATGGDLSLDSTSASALLSTNSGTVTLSASGNISVTNSGTGMAVNGALNAAANGNITLKSASDSPTISGPTVITADGDISITNTGTGMAVGGTLTVTKADSITVTGAGSPIIGGATDITADGDISITNTGTGMAVGSSLTATSTNGSVTVAGTHDSAPTVVGNATITAAKDIAITSASGIDISGTATLNAPNGMIMRTTSAGATITTADGTVCAYGIDISTSGLNISGSRQDGTADTTYSAPTKKTLYKAGSGYIIYTPAVTGDTPANAKLELHDTTISTTSGRALFLPAAPVDITVTGDNALTANGSYNFTIDPNGQAVNITGDGNVTLTGSAGIATWGSSTPSITIDIGGNLGISTTQSYSISANGNVNLSAASITTGIITAGSGSFTATAKTGNLTIGDGTSGSTAVIADNITLEAPNGAISVAGQDKLLVASGKVTLTAQSDIALTGTNTGDAIEYGTGVSITSNVGSINVTTSGYSCIYKKSSGAVTLNAAKDITLNANYAAIFATGEAVNLTAGGTLSSTSFYGFQVGALNVKANEVSIEGTEQDGIQATSVSITSPTGGNCKSVSITATSSNGSCAAIRALGNATDGNITVKADDLFICGNGSAKAISALGTVTIEGTGLIVGTIAAGTKSIASGITCASVSGGDAADGLNLSTAPAESTVYTTGTGYVVFTPATTATPAVLTLHNATIHNATNTNDATGTGIALPDGAVTIAVEGTNTVGAQCTNAISGSNTDVTLSGTGVLNVGYSGIALKSTAANPHSFTKGTGVTLNGIVNTYDNSSESGTSDTNTAYGNVTFPSGGEVSLQGAFTVTGGAVVNIPQDTTLDLKDATAIANNGTIVNNGTVLLAQSFNTESAVKALKLTGSGMVKVVAAYDADAGKVTEWDYYTNAGVAVKAITSGLTLTGTGDSTKTVAADGYSWDGSTLTLGNAYVSGGLTLPTNNTVTINSTSGSIINGTISGDGNAALRIAFSGTAPLTINGGINDGINGDAVTVQGGAQVTLNGYISIGASGTDGTLTVTGAGTVLDITSDSAYGAICDTINVQNGAHLTVHSEGSYGLEALDGGVHVTGGSTLTVGCEYGVYITDGIFEVDDSSTFVANASVAAVCVVDTNKAMTQDQALAVSSALIPSGTKKTNAIGDTSGYGYQYHSFASSTSTLTATVENNSPATLAGALGALTLKKAISPIDGGGSGSVSVSSYTLTFETNGGSTIDKLSKTSGTVIDLSTYKSTRDGYDFDGWYSDQALTAQITSVTLTKNTTVYAKWTEKIANPFVDVSDSDYYHDAVLWAVKNGVTGGTSNTAFSPDMNCTRAQMVAFLWRAEGSPEPTSEDCPFTDVSKDSYYYKAILWAVEKGITAGTSVTTFGSDDIVTRGQAVTFLWRAAGKPETTTANPFADVTADAYYYDAVLWAVQKGITQGTSAESFSPDSSCTRAQIVTFLYRYASE